MTRDPHSPWFPSECDGGPTVAKTLHSVRFGSGGDLTHHSRRDVAAAFPPPTSLSKESSCCELRVPAANGAFLRRTERYYGERSVLAANWQVEPWLRMCRPSSLRTCSPLAFRGVLTAATSEVLVRDFRWLSVSDREPCRGARSTRLWAPHDALKPNTSTHPPQTTRLVIWHPGRSEFF